jgi:hypothetical protein
MKKITVFLFPLLFLFSCVSTDTQTKPKKDTSQVMNVTLPAFLKLDEYYFEREDNSYNFTNKSYTREDLDSLEPKVISNLGTTDFFAGTINDVISVLGKPSRVVIYKVFSNEHLNLYYNNIDFYVGTSGINVKEIRMENPDTRFSYMNELTFGSSPDDVAKTLGQPKEIVNGRKNGWVDMTLYMDIDGQAGRGYISYHKSGVRFFFWDNKVSAIYLYRPNFPVP